MQTYSHSKLSTYEQCPLKYKYKYMDKIEAEIKTIEPFMGDMVHQVLEKLYKDLQFQKQNSLNDLLEFYDKLFEENYTDDILIVKKEYTKENYKEKGKQMIIDYYNTYKPFNQTKTVGLETTDFINLNDEYKIHVRVDRLALNEKGEYEIHDYKTNNSLKTQPEADEDRQLGIYQLGVKEIYPNADKIVLVWHFLAFDTEIRSTRSNEQLQKLKEQTIDLIKEIESKESFEPKKSALCDYCEYKKICPVWKHLYEKEDNLDEVKLVNEFVALKQKEKLLNKKIDELSEKILKVAQKKGYKELYGDSNSVLIWQKEAYKFPKKGELLRKEFIDVLKKLGLYELYADINNWDFEKEFEKLAYKDKQVLLNFAKKEKITRLYTK